MRHSTDWKDYELIDASSGERLERWGDKLTYWGGGVDAQGVLSFGTPEEVRAQIRERLSVFAPGGGYVFNPVHNVMPDTAMENVLAMIDEVRKFNDTY